MYRSTVVDLPPEVRTDEALKQWLENGPEAWRGALDLEVNYLDPIASLMRHKVDQISVSEGSVDVQYTVDYFVYSGCRDIDGSGQDCREISGEVAGGKVIFQTFVQPERMAPNEET